MKIFALVSCFFYLLSSIDSASLQNSKQDEWTLFKLRHGKSYKTQVEDNLRRIVFLDNQRKITEHNELYKKGEVSYKLGMNEFGDLLDYEFNEYMKGYNASLKKDGIARGHAITYLQPYNVIVPKNFDWRKKGAVTGVKNQKQCGSCWAFSATGSLEGQHFRKTGKLVSLSEQNLIDCSTKYGNAGCDGGNMDHSFLYVKDNHGLDTEASYPYEAANDKCRFNESNVGATDQGYVDLPRGDEQTLQLVVATIGPISVAIDASSYHFQFYKEGVYYNEKCDNDVGLLDHAVLAVGYGTEDGQDYWLVKNSWGTTWGMDGYVKMSRNRDNNCGIATAASYPLI